MDSNIEGQNENQTPGHGNEPAFQIPTPPETESKPVDDFEIELVGNVEPEDSARKPHKPVRICIDATVRHNMILHGSEDTSNERGGILVGKIEITDHPVVFVEAMIPARYTDQTSASLTFTHETWQDIHEIMDRNYSGKKVVGWYHTHPGIGVFLSQFDHHIHENFFNLFWQIAYVLDPISRTEGFFRWEDGRVQKTIEYDFTGDIPYMISDKDRAGKDFVDIMQDWRAWSIVALLIITLLLSIKLGQVNKALMETNASLQRQAQLLGSLQAEIQKQRAQGESRGGNMDRTLPGDMGFGEGEFTPQSIFDILPIPENSLATVINEDTTLASISKTFYGSENFVKLIFYANPEIKTPDEVIPSGTSIVIPGFAGTVSEEIKNPQVYSSLDEAEESVNSHITDRKKLEDNASAGISEMFEILPVNAYELHITGEGENLKTISALYYSNSDLWRPIFYANSDLLALDCLDDLAANSLIIVPMPKGGLSMDKPSDGENSVSGEGEDSPIKAKVKAVLKEEVEDD